MAISNSYDEQAVVQAIANALDIFYSTLIDKIDGLDIKKVMKRKNPYLYRAKAMQSASEIVESVLNAFVTSSEETIFGNCFFEPIAIAASGGNKALALVVFLVDEQAVLVLVRRHGNGLAVNSRDRLRDIAVTVVLIACAVFLGIILVGLGNKACHECFSAAFIVLKALVARGSVVYAELGLLYESAFVVVLVDYRAEQQTV